MYFSLYPGLYTYVLTVLHTRYYRSLHSLPIYVLACLQSFTFSLLSALLTYMSISLYPGLYLSLHTCLLSYYFASSYPYLKSFTCTCYLTFYMSYLLYPGPTSVHTYCLTVMPICCFTLIPIYVLPTILYYLFLLAILLTYVTVLHVSSIVPRP
jgi:hypothetical protein